MADKNLLSAASNRPTPFIERTGTEIPTVFSASQMPTKIVDCSMSTKESLSLLDRVESPHTSRPHPGSFPAASDSSYDQEIFDVPAAQIEFEL